MSKNMVDRSILLSLNRADQKAYVQRLCSDGHTCVLCGAVFTRLSTHLNSCIGHFVQGSGCFRGLGSKRITSGILSTGEEARSRSGIASAKLQTSQRQDYAGLRMLLNSRDENQQKEYILNKCTDGETCYICKKSFSGTKGLKIHLTTCIKKFLGDTPIQGKPDSASGECVQRPSISTTQRDAVDHELHAVAEDKRSEYRFSASESSECVQTTSTPNVQRDPKQQTSQRQDYAGLRMLLNSRDENQQKAYILNECKDGERCYLCERSFSGTKGLKIHLTTCIKKFLADTPMQGKPDSASGERVQRPSTSTAQRDAVDHELHGVAEDKRNEYRFPASESSDRVQTTSTTSAQRDAVIRELHAMSEDRRKEYVFNMTDGRKCYLCEGVYDRLKTHLGSCIKKHLSMTERPQSAFRGSNDGTIPKIPHKVADQDISTRDPEVLVNRLRNMAEADRKEYAYGLSDGKKCVLCFKVFDRLRIHLGHCIRKHVPSAAIQSSVEISHESSIQISPISNIMNADCYEAPCLVPNSMPCPEYIKNKIKPLSIDDSKEYISNLGNGNKCVLCDKTFDRLRSHLGSCIKKYKSSCEEETDDEVGHGLAKEECDTRQIINNSQHHIASVMKKMSPEMKSDELKVLQDRLQETALIKQDIKDTARTMNKFTECLRENLNDSFKMNLKWKILNSGSYYEKTKIYNIDEVDCMFVCKITLPHEYYEVRPSPLSRSHVAIHLSDNQWARSSQLCTKDGYLSPMLLRQEVLKRVEETVKQSRGIRIDNEQDPRSPAIRLKKRNGFDIDIVPGIELHGWPEVCKHWKAPEICDSHNKDMTTVYHVVAKPHHSEQSLKPDECKLWRLSFSQQEKRLMIHLDSDPGKTCRKDVLRLLKSDLMDARIVYGDTAYTKSYIVKTIILHMIKSYPKTKQWENESDVFCLLKRYKQALWIFKECVSRKFLEHAFILGENILEQSTQGLIGFVEQRLNKL